MKNFTKLLMTVVLLASYSCVQDTTEDLAPVISAPGSGSGVAGTLQVALPTPSRTELGDKGADGKYPVYWCAEDGNEDVLSVNGAPTTKITLVEPDGNNRSSVAIFDMPLQVSIPYNIVYPYSEGVDVDTQSGMYPVKFALKQKHTEGSFAPGSAPMYAWSDGFSEVNMVHLSTVLRFTIKAKAGEKVNLKYISVSTAKAEPISGIFDVYCGSSDENDERAGELKPRSGANSSVFYTFENDSYELGDTPQTFYIVVPKGEYERFDVNFVDVDGGVCVRSFEASGEDKALQGGKVREFPEIEYNSDSKMLLIGSDADMLTFATEVENGTFNQKYNGGALLVSNVDMTDVEWKSVEGYTSVFEGREYTIKGLKAPLFGENVVATISNVNVEGEITETANGKVGLIARSLASGGAIVNCSAKGKLTYSNPEITVSNDLRLINIGGIVGGIYGGSLSLSSSDVEVVVNSIGPKNEVNQYLPCVGGVVGYVCNADDVQSVVVENENNGKVVWNDDSESQSVCPYIGGVVGYVVAGEFSDNENNAELTIAKPMYDLDWGGVAGASATSLYRCDNNGHLTIDKEITTAHVGGVVGRLESIENSKPSMEDCDNYGKLTFEDDFVIKKSCDIGGVVSYAEKGVKIVRNCHNYGNISYDGQCVFVSATNSNGVNGGSSNASLHLGGVVGICYAELLSNCDNKEGADIDIAGGVASLNSDTDSSKLSSIAGVVGSRCGKQAKLGCESPVCTEDCDNEGRITCRYTYLGYPLIATSACIGLLDSDKVDNCHNANSGEFLYQTSIAVDNVGTETTSRRVLYLSGLISSLFSDCLDIKNCSNAGKFIYDNASGKNIYMSGLLGYAKSASAKLDGCRNEGQIVVGDNISCDQLLLGGIAASTSTYENLSYNNCYNLGEISVNAVSNSSIYLGGLFGKTETSNSQTETLGGLYNAGAISFAGSAPVIYIGGYAGLYEEEFHNVEFENRGEVNFRHRRNSTIENAYIGGFVGKANITQGDSSVTGVNFKVSNTGRVYSDGYAVNCYVSGGIAHLTSAINVLGIQNGGTVEVAQIEGVTKYAENIYVSGVAAFAKLNVPYAQGATSTSYLRTINKCSNAGSIIYKGTALDGAYIGGVVGLAQATPIVDCENTGEINSSGHAGDWESRLKSEGGRRYAQLLRHDLAIGGIVGETDHDLYACTNDGAVKHECLLNPLKVDAWGETSSSRFDLGGIVGRVYTTSTSQSYVNLISLTNTKRGVVTIEGSPYATTNTSSIGLSNSAPQSNDVDDSDRTNTFTYYRVNAAGIAGKLLDNSEQNKLTFTVSACKNEALVEAPNAGKAKNFNIAGVIGEIMACYVSVSATHNTGNVTVDNVGYGNSTATTTRHASYFVNMGGIMAQCFDYRWRLSGTSKALAHETLTFDNCSNSGKLYYGEVGASLWQCAGGILGQALHYVGDLGRDNNSKTIYRYCDKHITFNNCSNSGDIEYKSSAISLNYTYSYGGGILGCASNSQSNRAQRFAALDVTLNNCSNSGSIQFDRCNGYISTNNSYLYSAVGGMVGFFCGGTGVGAGAAAYEGISGRRPLDDLYRLLITSCKNSGRIWGYTGSIGGIVGLGYWYVKITGTEDNPTINTGDIVVARNGGSVVLRNNYGSKVIYAGGIAGTLWEYYSDTRYFWRHAGSNEGWPMYPLGTQYVRVEHAVNEGDVGGTGAAGGIVGNYQSLKMAAAELAPDVVYKGGIEFCRNTGNIYSLEGATSRVGAIIGMERSVLLSEYTSTSTSLTEDPIAAKVAAKEWPRGVSNCQVSGTILRGANRVLPTDKDTYQDCIYGENWNSKIFVSTVPDTKYDGCVFYEKPEENTPDTGDDEGDGGDAQPTTRR